MSTTTFKFSAFIGLRRYKITMEDSGVTATIFQVLANDVCRYTLLDYVPIKDLMRSQSVSKAWRTAVEDYLEHGCKLTLNIYTLRRLPYWSGHRVVSIPLQAFIFTLEKFGPAAVGVHTDHSNRFLFDILESNCPRLKSLSLTGCRSLVLDDFPSSSYLKNITKLELERIPIETLIRVHLLLDKMPKLESVSLCCYNLVCDDQDTISEQFIGCLRKLKHLRRFKLILAQDLKYYDALLEALTCCKSLERLAVSGSGLIKCVRGLAALILRAPAAETTLRFVQDVTSKERNELIRDLEVYGCENMIDEAVCCSRGQTVLKFKPGRAAVVHVKSHSELKITIDSVRLIDDDNYDLEDTWDTEDTSTTDESELF